MFTPAWMRVKEREWASDGVLCVYIVKADLRQEVGVNVSLKKKMSRVILGEMLWWVV